MHVRLVLLAAGAVYAAPVIAQTGGLSRSDAVQAAIERGARLGVARADTAVANAGLISARVRPNPALAVGYSKSVPNYHVAVDIPIDFPWLRQMRVQAAAYGLQAAQLRYQLARATVALDADTTYTRAIAARERLALSRRNALDTDSLLRMVIRRRDAGDASDMDVELARVSAGREENVAAGDSLTLISALSIFKRRSACRVSDWRFSDGFACRAPDAPLPGRTLGEAAAGLSLESATLNAKLQHKSFWSSPSVLLGFEYKDPDQPGLLPTFGIGIGLPLFDRNRGPIAQAEAERLRATAEVTLAQVEARNQIAHALRERESALARVARDRLVVTSATRVVAMSLAAYREGASSLSNVLEAQRTARDVLAQYIDDLANAWIATAELRVLAIVPSSNPQP
jgi:cobalt-zinc-cadmium efflux system outer membrane protein